MAQVPHNSVTGALLRDMHSRCVTVCVTVLEQLSPAAGLRQGDCSRSSSQPVHQARFVAQVPQQGLAGALHNVHQQQLHLHNKGLLPRGWQLAMLQRACKRADRGNRHKLVLTVN